MYMMAWETHSNGRFMLYEVLNAVEMFLNQK